jgi:hypothetical protein
MDTFVRFRRDRRVAPRRRWVAVAAFALLMTPVSGCTSVAGADPSPPPIRQQGAVGVWELTNPEDVGAETTTLRLAVTRLECSSGVTGTVLEPEVAYEESRIVIRTDVEPIPQTGYDCQGNNAVPLTVRLTEPVGRRSLVDAACQRGDAVDTIFCESGGLRWSP